MKSLMALLAAAGLAFSATAEESGGEHEKLPPPPPFKGSPVAAVLELQVVKDWKRGMAAHKNHLAAWGESVNQVEGHKCWSIVVGEARADGVHPWRRFCVPQEGGDILVENIVTRPDDEVTYMPYEKWVSSCKPAGSSEGDC